MANKVLLVDDDENLLNALKRHYRKRFDILTAIGPEEALICFENDADGFAVVVVDMRMPGMSGLELLEKINTVSPDTVRIMLTGNADQQTSVDAINQGNIFRFYNKPCDPYILAKGIEDGIEQHKLITAEQELLEHTLAGSVKVLVDILSMVDPVGFGRSDKIREWAHIVAKHLQLKQSWRLSMAAMLSQLGNITIPPEIMIKISEGANLTEAEQDIVDGVPETARDLIANIPRLKPVSDVVYLQNKGFDGSGLPKGGVQGSEIPVEARILKILLDLETKTHGGAFPTPHAFRSLLENKSQYDPKILVMIKKCLEADNTNDASSGAEEVEIPVSLLISGYTLLSDLKLEDDRLILSSGSSLSMAHIHKIRAFSKMHKFQEPVKVLRRCVDTAYKKA